MIQQNLKIKPYILGVDFTTAVDLDVTKRLEEKNDVNNVNRDG
jgi:hypothetical protein